MIDRIPDEKREKVIEKVERMNARAVVQRLELMSTQMAEFKTLLEQQARQIAMLQSRMDTEKLLQEHIRMNGGGPTA